MDKETLRQQLKETRANIVDRVQKDKLLQIRLQNFLIERFPLLKNVFVYVSIGSEADTHMFIESASNTYTLYYPLTMQNGEMLAVKALQFRRLKANRYGNLPSDCVTHAAVGLAPELTVTPLLGFNKVLQRIGYGRGCYDRYFSTTNTVKVGIAYDEQWHEFDAEEFDIPLDYIITPTTVWSR